MKWPWRGPAISKHFDTAIIKKTTTVLSAIVVLVSFSGTAWATSYDQQIAAARQAAAVAQAQANVAGAQANNYQEQVNKYQSQANAIQAQINLNVAKSNKLDAYIATAIASLTEQKLVLAANIKQMYLDSNVSPLEMLVSSQNISDFMNKQQYQDKVKTKVQDSMASILALKTQLDAQQKEVAQLLITEKGQRDQVATLLGQANALLAVAQQSAASANQQVQNENAQISSLKAAQAATFARLYRGGSSTSGSEGSLVYNNVQFGGACGGGYPSSLCSASTDAYIDSWGLYSRECVSYTAWAMSVRAGNMPDTQSNGMGGRANAYQWPDNINFSAFPQDNNPNGAAVVMIIPQSMIGGVGHAAVVESVSNGWVHVSQ